MRGFAWTEVGFSVVEAVAVDVVHQDAVRDSQNGAVHEYAFFADGTDCVGASNAYAGAPFVFYERPVVIGVYYCVFGLG